jgi:RNA polymerase sigma factor (sigma-70 family)
LTEVRNIINGCLNGDRSSQELLYRRNVARMYGVCLQYARNEEEANDILQEGFIKIFENLPSYRFEGSFEGWMRRIMVNTALEKYREKHNLYRVDDIDKLNEIEAEIEVGEYTGLEAEDLLNMIQALPPQYKIVFNLFAIEGYSHKEIGEMLGISPSTSKSNLSRARDILKRKVLRFTGIRRVING